jgi:HEPN domain-containing protein
MTKEELIAYWYDSAERDFQTMDHLFISKDYHWSLFIGHLLIEKLLKAIFVKNNDLSINPPKTHDLLVIADKAKVNTSENQKDILDMITTFNISARYPDFKQNFYHKCTEEFTTSMIDKIKEMRLWLISILEKK